MEITQKQKRSLKSKSVAITVFLVVLAVGGAGAAFVTRGNTQALAETVNVEVVKSKFSFSGANGWRQGATNETSMALFDDNSRMACFTSVEYKSGTVDALAEIKKAEATASERGNGYTVTPISAQTLTIQTPDGKKQYELYQSAVTTPTGGDKLKGGQEFGYLQLSDGYVKVIGYCDTPEQLSSTVPALQAIELRVAN